MSWMEQNVEKIVIGVVGATLVGVVALQALHQPNKVKVGTGGELPPERAFEPANKSARDLQAKISTSSPPAAPKVKGDLAQDLDTRLSKGVSPSPKIASLGPAARFDKIDDQGPVGTDLFADLKVPAPFNVIGVSHVATIHPLERVWHPDLASVLPAQQPFDKVSVSVEGTFNGTALLEALAVDLDGDGPIQPMPLSLWQDPMTREVYVEIVQVELERELLRPAPGSNEAVGTKAVIAGMPGRMDVRKYWSETVRSKGDVAGVLSQVRAQSQAIQRPPYYALIAGQPWDEPAILRDRWALGAGGVGQVNKLKADLTATRDQLKIAEDELAKLPAPGPAAQDRGRAEPAPAPPPRKGGGGQAAPRPPAPTVPKEKDPAAVRRTALGKVNNLKAKIVRIERQLEKLGVDTSQPQAPDQAQTPAPALGFFENEEVKLWVHDMTAAPGAAYRYRMRVVVNNPLYGASLVEQQKPLAAQSLVSGAFSDWSEPVEADALREFFVISANESNPPASYQPSAIARLFVYYYGRWRETNVGVTPGDVFAAEIKVPELPFYDLAKLGELFPEDKGFPAGGAAGPAPNNPAGPRGGRLANPGPAPAPAGRAPEGTDGPDGVARLEGAPFTPGPKSLAAGVASMFMDAQRLIIPGQDLVGQQREEIAAILRDANGRVVARSPEADTASMRYGRILAYLKAQEQAKAPMPVNVPGAPPRPPEPDQRPAPGGAGGAGGGAGGG
jgi:hypothetical protein